jgi:hypothetical protein
VEVETVVIQAKHEFLQAKEFPQSLGKKEKYRELD